MIFAKSAAFFFMHQFVFFYAIFIAAMKYNGLTASQISLIIVIHELVKIFADSHSGAMADKYGGKNILLLGIAIKACGFLLWSFSLVFWQFAAAVGIISLGKSFVIGKIDAYTYNLLAEKNQSNSYGNFLIVASIAEGLAATLAGVIISNFTAGLSFADLSQLSAAFLLLINLPFVLFFMPKEKNIHLSYSKLPLWKIIKEAVAVVGNNKIILPIVIISAVPASLYILCSNLYKMIAIDLSLTTMQVGQIYAMVHFLPVMASLLFLAIFRRRAAVPVQFAIFGVAICMLLCLFSTAFYGKLTIISIMIYLTFRPIFSSATRNALETIIPNKVRSTISSFSSLLSSVINIFGFLIIGFCAEKYSYKISVMFLSVFGSALIISAYFASLNKKSCK
jgi:MFS family permease